jgi:hypothetical protein
MISCTVKEVTQIMWNNLRGEFPNLPNTTYDWKEISSGSQTRVNFFHCTGTIDVKHIRIKNPSNSGSIFFSIILLAVVNSEFRFLYVSFGL